MSKVKILVVEDEKTTAADIVDRLKDLGYSCSETVATVEDALVKASKARPDVVLMNVSLKGDVNGFRAARQIQEALNIPIIYFSKPVTDAVQTSLQTPEARPFVLKPSVETELRLNIEATLYKHKMSHLRRLIRAGE
jgi:CheY-like chemotaxis protein